jgi:hypothetical protein
MAKFLVVILTLGGRPLGDADTWVFPFLNGFGIAGYIDDDGTIPIAVPVKDKWNFVTGFSYEFNHHWSADAQIGFLGSREEVILAGAYRF